MQRGAVNVEANLLAKRARMRNENRFTIREEPAASTYDANIDNLVRTMERMMERINLNERPALRDNQPAPQKGNQNLRRNPPQIRQREQRGPD